MRPPIRLGAVLTLAVSVAAVSVAAGCGRNSGDGKYFGTTARKGKEVTTFYLNNHDEPEYLDPGLSTESAGSTLLMDLFEGLVVQHPDDLRPTQGVAQRYDKSEDNRIWRFLLRDNAKWSDGKPVVAADFVYAWRRVLTASTGARMATMMYVIKNGRLFHRGQVKATKERVQLQAEPGKGATGEALGVGQAVKILHTSPVTVALAPVTGEPGADRSVTFTKGADGKPPALTLGKTAGGETALAKVSPAPEAATLLGLGPKVKCNGAPDRWYRVRKGEAEGWLPGCALQKDPKAEWALVEVFDGRPTFTPKAAEPPEAPEPAGEGGGQAGGASGEGGANADGGAAAGGSSGEGGAAANPPTKAAPRKAAREAATEPARGFVPLAKLADDPTLLGIRAVDDRTLEVELEEPTPYFLELAAVPTFYPVRKDLIEHFEAKGRPDLWYRPENIITNGAYVLSEHKFRYEMTFERNPHFHHRDDLKVHRIVWLEVPDYHATMNLYETGEIDYIGSNLSLPTAYMDRMTAYGDFDRSVYLATYWYEFNVNEKPVDDVRVRKALNFAVDKQLLIDKVTRGGQQPASHLVPDATGSGYHALAVDPKDPMGKALFAEADWGFNPEKARALLKEAGYEVTAKGDGFHTPTFPPLEILYNTSEGHRAIAVAVQDMWKRNLGISVQLRNEEWKVMIKNLRDRHFQVARFGWIADYNHPHTYLDTYLSYSNNNFTGWADPAYDQLVERAAATADPLASMRMYRQAERRAMDAMSRMPMYFYTKSTLIKPYVKGYYPNAANRHPVRWMWIDPEWKKGGPNVPSYAPEELPRPDVIAP